MISDSERRIRAEVVARARQLWPEARIIHELNVEHGMVRADIAAVTADQLILFEIKSERDKLHRLSAQLRHFGPVCHHLIVVAHERWCGGSKYPNCDVNPIISFAGFGHLWRYPEGDERWNAPWWCKSRPWPHRMLRLLWTDELRIIGREVGIEKASRLPGYKLADQLALSMSGAAIEAAVCSALRARHFAEADEPVVRRDAA